ncbi:MAG: AMP nucleosidase, partial [Chitinophagales bacterium]|nr:AMP nucleosidase [Chitinophagales bacterium]
LLISDQPMTPDGVKTAKSDGYVSQEFVHLQLKIGIDSIQQLINNGLTIKHLKF